MLFRSGLDQDIVAFGQIDIVPQAAGNLVGPASTGQGVVAATAEDEAKWVAQEMHGS